MDVNAELPNRLVAPAPLHDPLDGHLQLADGVAEGALVARVQVARHAWRQRRLHAPDGEHHDVVGLAGAAPNERAQRGDEDLAEDHLLRADAVGVDAEMKSGGLLDGVRVLGRPQELRGLVGRSALDLLDDHRRGVRLGHAVRHPARGVVVPVEVEEAHGLVAHRALRAADERDEELVEAHAPLPGAHEGLVEPRDELVAVPGVAETGAADDLGQLRVVHVRGLAFLALGEGRHAQGHHEAHVLGQDVLREARELGPEAADQRLVQLGPYLANLGRRLPHHAAVRRFLSAVLVAGLQEVRDDLRGDVLRGDALVGRGGASGGHGLVAVGELAQHRVLVAVLEQVARRRAMLRRRVPQPGGVLVVDHMHGFNQVRADVIPELALRVH
mmetsp:Transcript_51079/g.131716  ORF Transcript_51079/g.131716 Transcript_51079/m.131716 type:complete len:386 (-) Transcript_51079:1339-2496(-)